MKEYKVTVIANVLDVLVTWAFTLLLAYLFALLTKQDVWKCLIRFGFFGIIMDFAVFRKHLKRKIVIKPTSIQFSSYHIDNDYRDAEIDFASVERIGKCFSFNIKGSALCLKVSGYEKYINVDSTMENHKELFSEICKRAKLCNPDVKISKKVTDYLSE